MVKAVYKNDESEFLRFNTFTEMNVKHRKRSFVCYSIIAAAVLIIALLQAIIFGFSTNTVILLCVGLVITAFEIIQMICISRYIKENGLRLIRASEDFYRIENTYIFGDLSFTVQTDNGKETTTNEVKYSDLFCAYETEDFFYLYVNRNIAYIIKKSGIAEGTDKLLAEILQSRTKFRRRKKHG